MDIDFLKVKEELSIAYLEAEKGLPQEFFRFITTITPIINVDILVKDDNGRFLLSWRDDEEGVGWHVPGGILRYKETLDERIQKTAIGELGCQVIAPSLPTKISQSIVEKRVRGHFLSFFYLCEFSNKNYDIATYNFNKKENENGYLKWHDGCPSDILESHRQLYGDYLVIS